MKIRDFISQFTVYVYTPDVDPGASVKVFLSQEGYDAYFFQDLTSLEVRLKENPPHILVLSISGIESSIPEILFHINGINDEIKIIAISKLENFPDLSRFENLGLMDVVSEDVTCIESRVVWAVNHLCERLYLTYQSEQLYADFKQSSEKLKISERNISVYLDKIRELESLFPGGQNSESKKSLSEKVALYRGAASKEELIQLLLNNIFTIRCVYFKFLPSVRSFVATHATGIEGSSIQGVGCQLSQQEAQNIGVTLATAGTPFTFNNLLREALGFNPAKVIPVYGVRELEGAFVFSDKIEQRFKSHFIDEFSIFSICYSNLDLEKKIDFLEVFDHVTQLRNRNFYLNALNDEIERSRRLKQAVSVIKISIDNLKDIESKHGEFSRDEIIKNLANILIKGSRTIDHSCRTEFNEMALVLPHCTKKGAAIRAERIRKIIENTLFLSSGLRISVSIGISEFPSLSSSSKSLDESSSMALNHILEKGGNKIGIFKASENYRPEFEIANE